MFPDFLREKLINADKILWNHKLGDRQIILKTQDGDLFLLIFLARNMQAFLFAALFADLFHFALFYLFLFQSKKKIFCWPVESLLKSIIPGRLSLHTFSPEKCLRREEGIFWGVVQAISADGMHFLVFKVHDGNVGLGVFAV